jgi:hypothetical protein
MLVTVVGECTGNGTGGGRFWGTVGQPIRLLQNEILSLGGGVEEFGWVDCTAREENVKKHWRQRVVTSLKVVWGAGTTEKTF